MNRYDPSKSQNAALWLALSESERIDLVTEAHRREGLDAEALILHAALHTAVETQLAMGAPASVPQAMARLHSQGLSRHDAIHAIASVLAAQLQHAVGNDTSSAVSLPMAYDEAIAELDGVRWLESHLSGRGHG